MFKQVKIAFSHAELFTLVEVVQRAYEEADRITQDPEFYKIGMENVADVIARRFICESLLEKLGYYTDRLNKKGSIR